MTADLQCPECEKLLLPYRVGLKVIPGTTLMPKPFMMGLPPTATTAKRREHARRAIIVIDVVGLAVRTTPAIVSTVLTKPRTD